ncbi:C-C motif chemokine 4-like [Etheostoma spectabile]|uniref:C-C motif chemokine 4-like n=1 Tax=Etheostoma spectabile TaxID=54343 RepID=UPI0013AF6993|nr:C-C motif chemokine 4-like [Etheostoma spectabile]XP_032378371.1 C-C motif chemokine 4-like [Etheostoma spectabile]
MMKTLCFTLGLLLLSACCCNATLQAVEYSTAPKECCFNFYTQRIPLKRVSTITKTHSACPNKAFIVQTTKGKQFCYSGTSQWALDIYNQHHNTQGRSQQH